MHAIDVAFGGDSETTQVFRIGEASCAVPGAAAGLEAVHRGVRPAAVADPARARDRAGPVRRRGVAAAGAPARDPRPDPPAHRRGAARLQPAGRLTARAGRHPPAARSRRHVRADRRRRGRRALSGRARTDRSCAPWARAEAGSPSVTWRITASPGGDPVRRRLPRARGDLESAALVGRDPHRLRAGAARARGPRARPGASSRSHPSSR